MDTLLPWLYQQTANELISENKLENELQKILSEYENNAYGLH